MTLSENTGVPGNALSVSALNRQARRLLEQGLGRVWVEGEVSNLARPASGHVYFSLKDDNAQLRCAWFRQRQRGPNIHLKNGDAVVAYGQVSIYEARGDYQMIVEQVEPAGEGVLKRRFEALNKKLQAEGLFDEEHKRPLPEVPERIGVITSPTGAAVRDILTVLKRRFPLASVVIYPAAVQGDAAEGELVTALNKAYEREECDVLIIGRGGGSLEDLWPFNEEAVARTIFDSPIPIVSAVGHEVDFTIADFVADVRAPTPSGAAELVVPDASDWQQLITKLQSRIVNLGRRNLSDAAQSLDWLEKRLAQASPGATVARQAAWLRNLRQVMVAAMRHRLGKELTQLERNRSRLLQQSPALRVQNGVARLQAVSLRLEAAGRNNLQRRRNRLDYAARGLQAVSPLATLERGYAIVTDDKGKVLTDAAKAPSGTRISARLANGQLTADVVESTTEDSREKDSE